MYADEDDVSIDDDDDDVEAHGTVPVTKIKKEG